MNEQIPITLSYTTVGEFTLPRWMTPHAAHLFAIPTHMTINERLMLTQQALQLRPEFRALEVGSYLGASTAFLAFAATRIGGVVHAVDTWGNDIMGAEGKRDTLPEFQRNVAPFAHFIQTHRGWSLDIARAWSEPLDLLFIDGDHHEEAVVADLRAWLPFLKPGGWLAMHDIDHPDVRKAFERVIGARVAAPPSLVERLLVCQPTGFAPTG
jgi:predicted O-methyltransferase YrrM